MAYGLSFSAVSVIVLALWSGVVRAQLTVTDCTDLQTNFGTVQQGASPFFVAATSNSYTPNGPDVSVFLASANTVIAQSIILQARRADTNVPVGSFAVPSPALYQNFQCPSGSSTGTIISSNTTPKTLNLQFVWTPPANAVGDVIFVASLVDTENRAWLNVEAATPLSGPPPPTTTLTIGTCPTPTVSANGVIAFQSPTCLLNGQNNGLATCNPQSGSTIQAGSTTVTCTCIAGGTIEQCSANVVFNPTTPTPCNPSPCQNGGNCIPVPTLPNGFFCNCPAGITGDRCENGGTGPGPLAISPCPPALNNFGNTFIWTAPSCTRDGTVIGQASCTPASGSSFMGPVNSVTCTCTAGDEQATCPFNINAGPAGPACLPNPCVGGNECREATSTQAGYTCHSMTGTPCT